MENQCAWYDPSCGLAWIGNEIKQIFLWVYDAILSSFAKILEMLPVPAFLQNMQPFTIPSTVAWAAEALNLQFGLTVIVAAYTARFILRRIPVIG